MSNAADNFEADIAEFFEGEIRIKLLQFAEQQSTPPPWYNAVARLTPKSTDEERLAVYQVVRDANTFPADVGFFIVAHQIEELSRKRPQAELIAIDAELDVIARAHGLADGDMWRKGEAPPEYTLLDERYEALCRQGELDELVAHGEHEMAALLRADRDAYERRVEAGRSLLVGPLCNRPLLLRWWARELFRKVAACVEADMPMGPLACRYEVDSGVVQMSVYPTPVELMGGAYDGQLVDPGFRLDLGQLAKVLASVAGFGWCTQGLTDEGPYVWVEGGSSSVSRSMCRCWPRAPDDVEPGMRLDMVSKPRPGGR